MSRQRAKYTFTAAPEGYKQQTRLPIPVPQASSSLTSHKQYARHQDHLRKSKSVLLVNRPQAESLASRLSQAHLVFPSSNYGHPNIPQFRAQQATHSPPASKKNTHGMSRTQGSQSTSRSNSQSSFFQTSQTPAFLNHMTSVFTPNHDK